MTNPPRETRESRLCCAYASRSICDRSLGRGAGAVYRISVAWRACLRACFAGRRYDGVPLPAGRARCGHLVRPRAEALEHLGDLSAGEPRPPERGHRFYALFAGNAACCPLEHDRPCGRGAHQITPLQLGSACSVRSGMNDSAEWHRDRVAGRVLDPHRCGGHPQTAAFQQRAHLPSRNELT
jgi:hypothetical protein